MNVLIISNYFYPQNLIASFRINAFAKYFHEAGHDVTVLTVGDKDIITQWEGCEVHYLKDLIMSERKLQIISKSPEPQRMPLGVAEKPVNGTYNHPDDVDVLPLVEPADVVRLGNPSPVEYEVYGPRGSTPRRRARASGGSPCEGHRHTQAREGRTARRTTPRPCRGGR
ncbi:MAG: hypothetical protein K2H95_02855, partial [Bacteroidales bacterium]|nr:hypothetical protein [Bacteroidales bacterium]